MVSGGDGMDNQLYIYALVFLVLIIILSNLDKILGLFPKDTASKYKLKQGLMSRAEINFYKAFCEYKKDSNLVFAKVRLADIFAPEATGKSYLASFNKISAKHVDFLVCDKDTFAPLYAIELDDKSHRSAKSMNRDEFVNNVFSQTELKLIRVQARKDYSKAYLDGLFALNLPGMQNPHFKMGEKL
jgi:hypothetical protein